MVSLFLDNVYIQTRVEKIAIFIKEENNEETYEDEVTSIVHNISSNDLGGILHMLVYYDMAFVKSQRDSVLDDF